MEKRKGQAGNSVAPKCEKHSEVFHFYYYTPLFVYGRFPYAKLIEIMKVTISAGED
jgi:hypothetical protein